MSPRFKLAAYFTTGSVVILGLVAATLLYFHSRQSDFFESVQNEEIRRTLDMQGHVGSRAEEVTRRNLLSNQEAAHAHLARLLVQGLWTGGLSPLLVHAQGIDGERCRTLNDTAQQACQAAQGNAIRTLAPFAALDAQVHMALQGGPFIKVQLHDLRGRTVYSTDPAQIGLDASAVPGWVGAAQHGKVLSDLPLNDRLPAATAEEARARMVSFLPMVAPGTDRVVGVFEVHADVTALLRQARATSQVFQSATDANVQRATQRMHDTQEQLGRSARIQFVVIASLLAMLYLVLLAIVRRSQEVIRQQARETHAHRQRLIQNEKLATLGQMVASVAHQLKTPLAFSKSNVFTAIQSLDNLAGPIERSIYASHKEIAGDAHATVPQDLSDQRLISAVNKIPERLHTAQDMLGDVLIGMDQMSELVNHLHNFTRLEKVKTTSINLNHMLSTVMYIAKSVISEKVRLVEAYENLPPLTCNASQLNQAFLNLIVNAAQAIPGTGTVTVSTRCDRERITVCVVDTGEGIPKHVLPHIFDPYFTTKPAGEGAGLGLTMVKSIVKDHGGQVVVDSVAGVGTRFKVCLPLRS